MADCTVLILTYKGKHHLEDLLPSVKKAIEHTSAYNLDVLIVDNGRDNATRDYVKQNFPDYNYAFSPVNDYLFSLNPYVKELHAPYFLLLNDDMKITENIFNVLLPVIKNDPELFAINCKLLNWDGHGQQNNYRLMKVSTGWVQTFYSPQTDEVIRYTLYAGGGSAIFDTEKFNQLNGFNKLYAPAYCEDMDISYKAWTSGWPVIYHPHAILYHKEGGTIHDQYKPNNLTVNIYRNTVLWMIHNIFFRNFFLYFMLLLPYRLLVGWNYNRLTTIALWKALPRLIPAIAGRFKNKKGNVEDETIMALLGKPYVKKRMLNLVSS